MCLFICETGLGGGIISFLHIRSQEKVKCLVRNHSIVISRHLFSLKWRMKACLVSSYLDDS